MEGTQQWQADLPGKARAGAGLGGCHRAACAVGGGLVARSYLAGVDAALRIASTQVVAVDGPSVPAAAVAELDIDEADLGLLQDITWSPSCQHRKELTASSSLPVLLSSPPPPRCLAEALP